MDDMNNPDSLERLAKEAAEGAKYEFSPGAWSAMEQKLDTVPVKPFAWWRWGSAAVLVMATVAILLWPSDGPTQEVSQTEEVVESPKETQVEEKVLAKERVKSNDQNANLKVDAAQADIAENRQVLRSNQVTSSTSTSLTNIGLTQQALVSDNQSQTTNAQSSVPNYFEEAPVSDRALSKEIIESRDLSLVDANYQSTNRLFGKPLLGELPDVAIYQDEQPEDEADFKRWILGASASFDWTSTQFESFTYPGVMLGITAEYQFAKNWTIQSGVTYSVKKYRAWGEEYETPNWADFAPRAIYAVEATCHVIDVPINIKKYFDLKDNKQFFVSSGISSYIMLRENYDYLYRFDNPLQWPEEFSYENQNNHYLGILNMSVGYQKPISKKFILSVEPFLKMPLTGIGEGRVRLLSFGTNVAIKLR